MTELVALLAVLGAVLTVAVLLLVWAMVRSSARRERGFVKFGRERTWGTPPTPIPMCHVSTTVGAREAASGIGDDRGAHVPLFALSQGPVTAPAGVRPVYFWPWTAKARAKVRRA